jgi:flagellar hook-basal body complex protein FliE
MIDPLQPLRPIEVSGTQPSVRESDAAATSASFNKLLTSAIDKVNESQTKADNAIQALSSGKTDNMHQVMIALEEANIVLQFTVQLRNKVVEAYEEIMRMQV